MSENAFWRSLGRGMQKNAAWKEATRHEDKLQSGICDVSFVDNLSGHGWMELKQVNEWPKRSATILHCRHYTDAQRIWMKRKGSAGGNVWLLIKVERDVLLFDWFMALDVGRTMTRQDMFCKAKDYWRGKMNYSALGNRLMLGC